MDGRSEYRRVFDDAAIAHLGAIDRKHHSLIRRAITEQLAHQPNHETRNRKPLDRPLIADAIWELRCGPSNRFRVFYDVDEGRREVVILAIGIKDRNRLLVGGKEYRDEDRDSR
jgi:mRNA-degrading endonuclease RelE of RelBE toxin-antitoxin system